MLLIESAKHYSFIVTGNRYSRILPRSRFLDAIQNVLDTLVWRNQHYKLVSLVYGKPTLWLFLWCVLHANELISKDKRLSRTMVTKCLIFATKLLQQQIDEAALVKNDSWGTIGPIISSLPPDNLKLMITNFAGGVHIRTFIENGVVVFGLLKNSETSENTQLYGLYTTFMHWILYEQLKWKAFGDMTRASRSIVEGLSHKFRTSALHSAYLVRDYLDYMEFLLPELYAIGVVYYEGPIHFRNDTYEWGTFANIWVKTLSFMIDYDSYCISYFKSSPWVFPKVIQVSNPKFDPFHHCILCTYQSIVFSALKLIYKRNKCPRRNSSRVDVDQEAWDYLYKQLNDNSPKVLDSNEWGVLSHQDQLRQNIIKAVQVLSPSASGMILHSR